MYIAQSDLAALIPADFLTQALDDDGDGIVDAWATVQAAACCEVDAILGVRYTVPLPTPYPAVVIHAARTLAAEACYLRRGSPAEKNPFTAAAKTVRLQLRDIALGALPLDPTISRPKPSAILITEPARTAGTFLSI
ncbi:MAG: phage protein Gp36 family protein [Verrucomicrobiae bacterium]